MKTGTKIFIGIVILLVIAAGVGFGYWYFYMRDAGNEQDVDYADAKNDVLNVEVVKKEIQTFKGNDRPIAVMIDNHRDAWPQGGLNDAYMVYEIVVEGGETRLMALFKGKDVEKIGPVRSSRHYFLDYAMENDAIYVHYGWSPQAQSDISRYKINNINGITESTTSFWRTSDKAAPHNVATSIAKIKEIAEAKKYRTTSDKESVLTYSVDEIELEDGGGAISVTIPHSNLQTVKYVYDEENKVYNRYARNREQTDWETGDTVTAKNIIITKCDNYTLGGADNAGRQGLTNIGTFDGYYITNGKVIAIKCIKSSRDSQTVYQDLDGNEIKVNDGNTWVNICPRSSKVEFESPVILDVLDEEVQLFRKYGKDFEYEYL